MNYGGYTKIKQINLDDHQRGPKTVEIINRSLDHLAKTTNTNASQRCAAILAPPSPELGKSCVVELVVGDKHKIIVLSPKETNQSNNHR
jgi:hypothetical protein